MRRDGVAIFVVMSVVLVLGAFATMVWTNQTPAAAEQSFEKRQAEYLAKGAQQHALLKCRLMPTELYDAVSYSIGRNPYFDFGRGLKKDIPGGGNKLDDEDSVDTPGPMFYTGDTPTIERITDPDSTNPDKKILKITRTGNISETPGGVDTDMSTLLNMYTYDVATLFPAAQLDKAVVVVDSREHNDVAMGDGWRDPFIGNYKVQQLRILGLQGGRLYDRDTMLLTTIGSVKRLKQISLVTNLNGEPRNLSPIRRVSRTAGKDSFGEYDTVFEGQQSYEDRVGGEEDGVDTNDVFGSTDNPDGASGRRTEIATGIYFITRKAVNSSGP